MSEKPSPRVGIGVLIFNKQNALLLGKRKGKHGFDTWGPPGGHLENGESFSDCAKRETSEECGLILTETRFLSITNDIFPQNNKHYISIFVGAKAPENAIPATLEPDKINDWRWFSLDKLPSPLFFPLQNFLLGKHFSHLSTPSLLNVDEIFHDKV